MLVAIPSKGRAGKVKSTKVLPSATLFVPEDEVTGYRACGDEMIVGVPLKIKGITQTRNWILKQTIDPWVVFVDDDVMRQGWIRLKHRTAKHTSLTEPVWIEEWKKLFWLTEQLGLRIWGLNTDGAVRSVYPWRPFIFHTYVTASCMGLLTRSGLRFDESFPVKEDYELNLRCLKEDGGVLGCRYLYWRNSHWGDKGGCKDYRTQAMEEDCIQRLIERYPGYIRQVTRGGSGYAIELDF